MRHLLRTLRHDQRGFSLVLALCSLSVLSLVIVSVITYTTQNQHNSDTSKASQNAYALAEAGINNAESILSAPNNNALDSALLSSSPAATDCDVAGTTCMSKVYDSGTSKWYGTFSASTSIWTIHAYGYVTNPTRAGSTIERKINATIKVQPDPTQPQNATAWNYVMATDTTNSTTCDVLIDNTVTISTSTYIEGNLCLNNSSSVQETNAADPVTLTVRGKVAIQGSQSKVGTSAAAPISYANIGGGCTSSISTAGHVCNPNSPVNDKFWVKAGNYSQTTTQIAKPVADWAGYYNTAQPGPKNACTTSSGTPPTWDNDTTQNLATNGSAGSFDLTPSSSYSCKYDSGGQTLGELTWNVTTHTLTIKGVMYYDGSMYVSNNATNVYNGSATIYLTGTFSMTNGSTRLCAVNTGSACDFSTWNPSTEMLIFVAHGNDGSGNSATFSQGVHFQGGLFAEHAIDFGQSSTVEGPMIGGDVKLSNSVNLKPLPYINTLPLGAPGNPNTHATPAAPIFTS
jgi:Tfp pilus assembly protein PilX